MSRETFYTWVLPLLIAGFGGLYGWWAVWTNDRAVAREEGERAAQAKTVAE